MSTPTAQLAAAGVSIWLDDLSRTRIASGNLADLISSRNVVGVTTNPTIFANAITDKNDTSYDAQVTELAASGATAEEAVFAATTQDVAAALDVFRPVWEASNHVDGRVSIEVSPDLAHDTAGTVAQAKELWAKVDRPNLLVKIPATKAGLPAIAEAIGAGISVNVTLIFSLERYAEVIEAYLTGLETAKAAGIDLSTIHSVASFFVSRVDTETDKRLTAIGTDAAEALKSKAGLANARLAYELFEKTFAGDRATALARSSRPGPAISLLMHSVVMRLLDRESVVLDFKALGFTDEFLSDFVKVLEQPHGILLVTGPTGSGKTTTLYTALNQLNTDKVKIITDQ